MKWEEYIAKIKEEIGKTVNDNNYKLALAITGHKIGKIKDVNLASAEGEAILDYIKKLEQENKKLKREKEQLKAFLENEWKKSHDIWFVKIINKINEIEKSDHED